jgi:hypothetical protein
LCISDAPDTISESSKGLAFAVVAEDLIFFSVKKKKTLCYLSTRVAIELRSAYPLSLLSPVCVCVCVCVCV